MTIMRKYILTLAAALFVSAAANAQNPVNRSADVFTNGVRTSNVTLTPTSTMMNVAMDIDYSAAEIGRKEALDIVPVLTDGTHTKELPAIGVYGGRRYWNYLRNGGKTGKDFTLYKAGKAPATEHYTANVPYEGWMDNCQLILRQSTRGCCNSTLQQGASTLAAISKEFKFEPNFLYVQPDAENVKLRAEKGEAYLEFPVGQAKVDKNFKNNADEIQKIVDMVNTLAANKQEYKVNGIALKGYASPDGSYKTNERLAMDRTGSLKIVVKNALKDLNIPISTNYEAEDWDGVKSFVEASSLDKKDEILAVINGNLTPDQKEQKLKSSFPQQYNVLKNECFPALRRSSYTVNYEVASFIDATQIKNKINTNPKDLSLNEFFIAANSCAAGSPEFNEIMEKALQQYPNNEIAKLNAANAAMSSGNLQRAGELLSNIKEGGLSKQAAYVTYAKAIYEAMSGHYAKASKMFTTVKDKIPEAASALKQLANAK